MKYDYESFKHELSSSGLFSTPFFISYMVSWYHFENPYSKFIDDFTLQIDTFGKMIIPLILIRLKLA